VRRATEMSEEENKAVVRRFVEEMDKGNLDVADELVSPDAEDHSPMPGTPTRGPAAPKAVWSMLLQAFPGAQNEVLDMLAEGDKVVIRSRFTGRHDGDFMGVPATGKEVSAESIDVVVVRDNKMYDHWASSTPGS
jgi:predicted ester cyclase